MTQYAEHAGAPAVEALVGCIVSSVHPKHIGLFGSAARGTMGPDSDCDALVAASEGLNRHRAATSAYESCARLPFEVDGVVTTESDLEQHGDSVGLVYYRARKEGRQVYAA